MGRKHHKKRGPYAKHACLHCRQCKSKCDNNIPCGHCVKNLRECIKPGINSKSYEELLIITIPKTRRRRSVSKTLPKTRRRRSVSKTLPKTRRYTQRKSISKTLNKTLSETKKKPQRKQLSKTLPKTVKKKSELLYDFSLSEEDYNSSHNEEEDYSNFTRLTETKMNFFIKQFSASDYTTNIPEKIYSGNHKYNIKLEFISVLYPYHTIHFQLKNNETGEIIKYNKKNKHAITVTQELSFDNIFKIYNYIVKFNTCSHKHDKCDFVLEILLIPNKIIGASLDLNKYNNGVFNIFTSSPFKLYVNKRKSKPESKNRKRKYDWNDLKENLINPPKKRKF